MRIKNLLYGVVASTVLFSTAVVAKTDVIWWEYSEEGSGLNDALVKYIQDGFNQSQENVELEIIFKEGEYNEATRTALLAGVGPDIISSSGATYVAKYASGGFLMSLEEVAEKNGWKDKILPWAYNTGVFGGNLYSLPKNYESMLYFYNKTLFDENGWSLPTNLGEYEALAGMIQSKGMYPFAYGSSGWPMTHEHLAGNYLNTVAGPDNVYKAMIGEKEWTAPEFVEALELLKKHMMAGYWSGSLENYYAVGWDDFSAQFHNREAAMLQIGSWGFEIATALEGDEWGWAPLPILTENGGEPNYQLSVGGTLSVNAASKNQDAAAEVLNWIVSNRETIVEFTKSRDFGAWLMPLYYEASDFGDDVDPRLRDYLVDFSERTGKGHYGYTTWTYYPPEAGTHIWKDMEVVWAGDISVKEFLGEQQELWEKARKNNELLPIAAR